MKKILVLIVALAAFIPVANAQRVMETHQFAVKDGEALFVDRHIDPAKVKGDLIPTMIYMYGGGWAFGGRGGDFSYLTDIGVQVISIDYRKGLTKYGYNPAPPEEMEKAIDMALDDLTDAMAFVLAHAQEWKVDVDKVCFLVLVPVVLQRFCLSTTSATTDLIQRNSLRDGCLLVTSDMPEQSSTVSRNSAGQRNRVL